LTLFGTIFSVYQDFWPPFSAQTVITLLAYIWDFAEIKYIVLYCKWNQRFKLSYWKRYCAIVLGIYDLLMKYDNCSPLCQCFRYALLLKYDNADITLTLPGNITVYNLKWFSMWCKRVEVIYYYCLFPN